MNTPHTLGERLRRARYRAMLTDCVECYERWEERFDIAEFCTAIPVDMELMQTVCSEHSLEIVENFACTMTHCPCKGKGMRLRLKEVN